MMATTRTLKSLARGVKISSTFGARLDWDKQDDWQKTATGYTVTLKYQGRQMTVDFWMGSAHTAEPDAEGVLECLLSDASAGEQSFEDFCSDMGEDPDSRKAERTWKACATNAEKLRRLLGSDFDTFMQSER